MLSWKGYSAAHDRLTLGMTCGPWDYSKPLPKRARGKSAEVSRSSVMCVVMADLWLFGSRV